MQPEVGQTATITETVSDQDTAVALGSGDVEVLGTPRVLALAERAAVEAVQGSLPDGRTSVGTWAEVFHTAPTRVGQEVTVTAELTHVDGNKLAFAITAATDGKEVARVEHRRAVVERARFG